MAGDASALLTTARGLLTNCEANLADWHRPGGPAAGLSEWRLNPPRKLKIDPSELRLDRSLDLQRTTPKGTSPAGRPS